MRRWRALAIAPLAALLVTGPVLAQDSTPEADSTENPRLVNPSECVAEPRDYDDIAAILNLDGEGVPAPAMTQITPHLARSPTPRPPSPSNRPRARFWPASTPGTSRGQQG